MNESPQTDLASRLDAWLPQTQCTQCGYPRCRQYAEAVARGDADINQCPPGGDVTIRALADLVGKTPLPLNRVHGDHKPREVAAIDEGICIGCRKCIDACPVDAIVGARKLMHTVIAVECTGCGLCVPPCPVDCIAMLAVATVGDRWPEYPQAQTNRWRERTERRLARLARRKTEPADSAAAKSIFPDSETIRGDIRAAVARAREKKLARDGV
jgi:electron transport complex protein RnfB